jgi:hypothetical protein
MQNIWRAGFVRLIRMGVCSDNDRLFQCGHLLVTTKIQDVLQNYYRSLYGIGSRECASAFFRKQPSND